ncbi:T9SS type A sorting domain-containing protein [Hymenobacter gummosus]|uniref:T9SS type A sorting domain-containing protein n=1 Tax=Hymenobacter gummosus TaxID=1776032 RepID=A0A431U2K0_9BACT|nr:LamG-like jellyroll fold domain-containing protein [Hymenobacter gummosus]RTQ49608.1 T9SS type A sorting domain-containing protein [Hymenobacter gummosus]
MRRLLPFLSLLLLPMSLPAQVNLQQGLVAHYPFDGDARDVSGNGNHGTLTGLVMPTLDRNGSIGRAMLFNSGMGGYITMPHSASLATPTTQLSIAVWIRITGASYGSSQALSDPILEKADVAGSVSQYGMGLYFSWTARPGCYGIAANGFAQSQCADLSGGQPWNHTAPWTHVVLSYDGSIVRHYFNGQLLSQQAANVRFIPNTLPLQIGTMRGGSLLGVSYLNGILDELRIYNRTLSDAEIATLAGATPTATRPSPGHLSLSVYPNPAAEGTCYLQPGPEARGTASLSITDALGRVVRRQAVSVTPGAILPVPVAGLPAGLYAVRLQGNGWGG